MWEPAADYENFDIIGRDSVIKDRMKHPQPLQTIGDIVYDQGELNPRTYAEYSNSSPHRTGRQDFVPGQLYPDGEHHDDDEEGNAKTFKRVIVRFAERTSMQGVPYIYVSSVWYAKLGWSLLFFVGFCLMVAHLYLLFDEFYERNTHSSVDLGFSTLVFPAVTICNVNPIKQSKMYMATPELRALVEAVQPTNIAGSMEEERNRLLAEQAGNAIVQPPVTGSTRRRRSVNEMHKETAKKRYKRFIDGFSIQESNNRKADEQDGGPSGNKSAIRAIEDEFRFLYSTMSRTTRYEMGHGIDEMLMECTFRGITCETSEFRMTQTAQYGNCYTLENNRYISTVGGPDDGLTMYLFMEDNEYLHGITNSLGFQVHIHNIGEMPNPYSEGLSVSAGMETFIGLKKVNIARQKSPYGDCVENEDFKKLYNITYTQRTCQAFCLQRTVVEQCGCFDSENDEIFKSLADAKVIVNPSNTSQRYEPCRSQEESTCYRTQVRRFQEQDFECDCPSPCRESLYTKQLSSKIWPTEEYAGILVEYLCTQVNETTCQTYKQKTRSEIATSFLKMVIYYEDLNYENITEEVDYETFQFVSDVGGTIGLWIGLSMISFFEVIQFVYEMVHYVVYTKPKQARERARKQKLRQARNNSMQALRFINPNGTMPMSSVASKLMSPDPAGSKSSSHRSGPKRTSKPKDGSGSGGDSGNGGDSLKSDREPRILPMPQGKHGPAHRYNGHPWHSDNHAFREDQVPGMRDMSMMSGPIGYMGSPYRGPGVDPRDVDVNFGHHKYH